MDNSRCGCFSSLMIWLLLFCGNGVDGQACGSITVSTSIPGCNGNIVVGGMSTIQCLHDATAATGIRWFNGSEVAYIEVISPPSSEAQPGYEGKLAGKVGNGYHNLTFIEPTAEELTAADWTCSVYTAQCFTGKSTVLSLPVDETEYAPSDVYIFMDDKPVVAADQLKSVIEGTNLRCVSSSIPKSSVIMTINRNELTDPTYTTFRVNNCPRFQNSVNVTIGKVESNALFGCKAVFQDATIPASVINGETSLPNFAPVEVFSPLEIVGISIGCFVAISALIGIAYYVYVRHTR